jgi:hypothetical protein
MMNEVIANQLLLSFGMTQEEIDKLSTRTALSYIRFYHPKKYQKSSILFRGFSKTDSEALAHVATSYKLTVNSRLSPNLTFLCIDNHTDFQSFETVKINGTRILRRAEFDLLFPENISDYDLLDNETLYDLSVARELRIAKPLSNFDSTLKMNSFSLESENVYDVNLFNLECSCADFSKKERHKYSKGDIRRLCKHLMSEYKNSFGVFGQSNFNRFVFDNGHSLKQHFNDFVIGKTNQKVILNYDNAYDWCSIYVEDKTSSYKNYGYLPSQKGFAYDDKPIGIVKPLREKLDLIFDTNRPVTKKRNKTSEPQGCAPIVVLALLVVLVLTILTSN